jgi:hypothetical protein
MKHILALAFSLLALAISSAHAGEDEAAGKVWKLNWALEMAPGLLLLAEERNASRLR